MSLIPYSFTYAGGTEARFDFQMAGADGTSGRFIVAGSLQDEGPIPVLNLHILNNGVKFDAEGTFKGSLTPGRVSMAVGCYGMSHDDARARVTGLTAFLNEPGDLRAREFKSAGASPNYDQYIVSARCVMAAPQFRRGPVLAGKSVIIDVLVAFELIGEWAVS